ncbi:hypothetical protein [Candidatus Viridilinea mediisalina]|uniref:Uncharacterized protein n=1 Tax=Candidatus Viridilinea mediisalina TaxID=2024553 RepID=A0A2A6RKK6_9CHLR|nr:hypothetical protein [Candidatus Viridilinea mediisalina]PDW03435.1 hypothetical protein CJ255_08885 [Candidatus Viridilinea mediisalina]
MRGRSVRKTERSGGGEEALRLTRCAGTWLAEPPDGAEEQRIAEAAHVLKEQRAQATAFYRDPVAARAFSIKLFRDERFAPLHFGDALVEKMIAQCGEPPVVTAETEEQFSNYLRDAILVVALPNTRRLLAAQLRRMLPAYVAAGQWQEAIAIDHNAFRTSLGTEVTPFLAHMALAGLAAYYEEHEA